MFEHSFEHEHSAISESDLERWKRGGDVFRRFFDTLTEEDRESIAPKDRLLRAKSKEGVAQRLQESVGPLQLLFLGERAITFEGPFSDSVEEKLRAAGFKRAGEYVYSSVAVERIMRQYPDAFQEYPTDSAEAFMTAFAMLDFKEHGTVRGLLLGYPLQAVRDFEEKGERPQMLSNFFMKIFGNERLLQVHPNIHALIEEYRANKRPDQYWAFVFLRDNMRRFAREAGVSDEEANRMRDMADRELRKRGFGACGVGWIDDERSEESLAHQERWKMAFETSGVLNVQWPLPSFTSEIPAQREKLRRSYADAAQHSSPPHSDEPQSQ